jgi:hypothetical protein
LTKARPAQTEDEYRELLRITQQYEEAAPTLRLGVVLRDGTVLLGKPGGISRGGRSGSMRLVLDDGQTVEIDLLDVNILGPA